MNAKFWRLVERPTLVILLGVGEASAATTHHVKNEMAADRVQRKGRRGLYIKAGVLVLERRERRDYRRRKKKRANMPTNKYSLLAYASTFFSPLSICEKMREKTSFLRI
jgi:hypothetical protein